MAMQRFFHALDFRLFLTKFTISFVNIGLYGTAEMTTVLSYDKKSAIMPDVVWNISEE
jgi:hypothetical protein